MFCLDQDFCWTDLNSAQLWTGAPVSGLPYMALITAGVVVAVIMPHTDFISEQNH